MICGAIGRYHRTVIDAIEVLGLQQGVEMPAAMSAMVLPQGTIFLCDTHVLHDPDARQIARMTIWAAEVMPRFGVVPASISITVNQGFAQKSTWSPAGGTWNSATRTSGSPGATPPISVGNVMLCDQT